MLAALAVTGGLLAGCGGDDSKTAQLNWYINPDGQETLTKIAGQCSTDKYKINIQLLPASATDQRTQLARRLAAKDDSTDMMSLDPVFVPEFASAGWLAELPKDTVDDDVLEGPAKTVDWEDKIYAAPQWANTQVLWYRKSLAEKAGLKLSPTQTATWAELIDGASKEGATIGVQANKYEGYTVWINALIMGAGGDIVTNTESGRDAKVAINSPAGQKAAEVIAKLSSSKARQPDLSVSNEGTSLGLMFPEDGPGEFMVNWTFVYGNYKDTVGKAGGPKDKKALEDLGWAPYPETVKGEQSRPPVGGIDIGVSSYSKNVDAAKEAARCVSNEKAQAQLAINDALMPSRQSVYDSPELKKNFPSSLLELYQKSLENGGPRPKSAFYNQISGAIQSTWHGPTDVTAKQTPKESADFLTAVLEGKSLL